MTKAIVSRVHNSSGSEVGLRNVPAKYAWIDVLRGVAIIGVVSVHTSQLCVGLNAPLIYIFMFGQMGVQLFFVASAITLCLSMADRAERHPIISFFIRRYFRIAPLYYSGIALFASLPNNFLRAHGLYIGTTDNLPNIVANILFVHGFYRPGNNTVVPGGWSIGTEMSFYAIFPLMFSVFKSIGKKRQVMAALVIGLCGLIELLIGGLTKHWPLNNSFEYFSLLNQLPVFVIGILAYYQLKSVSLKIPLVAIVGLLTLFTALVFWRSHALMAFYFIPILCAYSFSSLALILSRTKMRYPCLLIDIGKKSYSLYILHVFFLLFISWAFNQFHVSLPPILGFLLRFIFTFGLSYVGAHITERLIELHGINVGHKIVATVQAHQW